MKKLYAFLIPVLVLTFVFSTSLSAQETTVSVKVKKDGKVVKDTTYSFEDEAQAEHALMMMDMMGSEGEHHHGKKVVVVKTCDGETFDILIDEEGEDEDGNIVKTKEVKVIVSSDDDGEWTVTEEKVVKKKSKKQ